MEVMRGLSSEARDNQQLKYLIDNMTEVKAVELDGDKAFQIEDDFRYYIVTKYGRVYVSPVENWKPWELEELCITSGKKDRAYILFNGGTEYEKVVAKYIVVAFCFLRYEWLDENKASGEYLQKCIVNHKDNCSFNDRVSNIEFVTTFWNNIHGKFVKELSKYDEFLNRFEIRQRNGGIEVKCLYEGFSWKDIYSYLYENDKLDWLDHQKKLSLEDMKNFEKHLIKIGVWKNIE